MNNSGTLQIPSQESPSGPRPASAAVQSAAAPSSSSRRQQRASHTVVSPAQANHNNASSRDDAPYTDVYSHPAAVAYAAAHPRRNIPRFGPYLLLQTLGEGEFGKVKLGLHCQWGEEVAVKLIKRGSVDNTVRMSKVEREIEVLRTLKHPNIVRLYDVIETDKYIGIIIEYASGGELFDYILAHRYLREKDAAKLFSQLISGVWYIHQKKIVHRDLKLENLLLDRHRNVIITDFGFANRFEHRADDLMQTSCGSPCYAAPELVISEGLYVGSAVDIWSCGVILYAMLAGYLPFDDDPANPDGDNINLLYKYIVSTPLSFPDHISPEARDLLGMMLVPDPKRRSGLQEIMRHPWLASYTAPKDSQTQVPIGAPTAFGRTVDQLERSALEQHQQRRLAYQRQMRAAAQAAQQQATSPPHVGRSQSHQIPTGGSGHRQAVTESAAPPSSGRSHSTQPEFLYDSSVDLSVNATASPASASASASGTRKQPPVVGGDDDPFGPPPSASAGKAAMLAAEAGQSPKGHKVSGSGGFRHTIQVEYDEPRSHGRSPSQGQSARRSEDREGRTSGQEMQQQQQQARQSQQQQQPQTSPAVASPALPPKEHRSPSQGSPHSQAVKPLPSTPPSANVPTAANGVATTPSSFRGPSSPSANIPTSPRAPSATPTKSHHSRTPSMPVTPVSPTTAIISLPSINVDGGNAPEGPITFAIPEGAEATDYDQGRSVTSPKVHQRGKASLDKLGLGKMFSGHGGGGGGSGAGSSAENSPRRVPSDSGKSTSSVLLGSSAEKAKEGQEKEGKKSRRNTLTVMVEPFRSTLRNRGARGKATGNSGGDSATSTGLNSAEKLPPARTPQAPHSALVGSGGKSSAGQEASFAGAAGEIGGVVDGGVGMRGSSSKAWKVMAWFRSKSKSKEDEDDGQGAKSPEQRSTTPTQLEFGAAAFSPGKRNQNASPVQVVVTTPTSSNIPSAMSPRIQPLRTASAATGDTSFSGTATPSLVTRFRNSVTIGGRDRERDRTASSARQQAQHQQHQQQQQQHPWGMLRTHHGPLDQSTITTKPPPEVIRHVREVLESMGVEIQIESEYKFRCVRVKRRKGSMAMGASNASPTLGSVGPGGNLAAVSVMGSAASNGVDRRGLPIPSSSSFAPAGMLRGLLMRRQSSQVSSLGLASPLDDDVSSPLATEPVITNGMATYGDPSQDAGDEVKFSVELTRVDRLMDTFSLDIRRLKGNLRSYKFLYDMIRDRTDLQR